MADQTPDSPGGMSQEDIDAALAASGEGTGDAPGAEKSADQEPKGASSGDFSGFSQSDIDAALDAAESNSAKDIGSSMDEGPSSGGEVKEDTGDSDGGESSGDFSQAEIDAALNDAQGAGEASASSSEGTTEATTDSSAMTNDDGTPKLDSQGRPFDEAAAMMEAAIAEERAAAEAAKAAQPAAEVSSAPQPLPPAPANSVPLDLPDFSGSGVSAKTQEGINLLSDVKLDVKIELGRAQLLIEDVLKLGDGSVVELDKLAGDPVDVLVNNRLVARGEVLVLNDNFCVRISEIMAGAAG